MPLFFPQGHMTRVHKRLDRLLRFPIWVVCLPVTREYPGKWVARCHVLSPVPRPTRWVILHDTLPELRAVIPAGLSRMDRDVSDDDMIVEIWV